MGSKSVMNKPANACRSRQYATKNQARSALLADAFYRGFLNNHPYRDFLLAMFSENNNKLGRKSLLVLRDRELEALRLFADGADRPADEVKNSETMKLLEQGLLLFSVDELNAYIVRITPYGENVLSEENTK